MIRTLIRKEIVVLLREKGAFFWLFLMPMLFILLFASIFSNAKDTLTIGYFDADQTSASKQLIQTIDGITGIDTADRGASGQTLDMAIDRIRNGKATSLLVIPSGFESGMQNGGSADLKLYRDGTADTAVAPVLALLKNVSSSYRDVKLQTILKAEGMGDGEIQTLLMDPIVLSDIKENAVKETAVTQYVPGYTVMFVFFILITMIRGFFKDRDSGMLARLCSTPMKAHQYLIGMWVPNVLVVLVQCTVLLTFGKVVYDVNLGDPLAIILLVLTLALCSTGIGLALCMFVKSENQGTAYTQIITMGGAVIAGLWFPFEIMPDFAQTLGRFTPQYWAQIGFQNVMVRGQHAADIAPSLGVLAAYAVGGLLLALLRYRKYLRTVTA